MIGNCSHCKRTLDTVNVHPVRASNYSLPPGVTWVAVSCPHCRLTIGIVTAPQKR